jgi:short-subunit dehydrogenase
MTESTLANYVIIGASQGLGRGLAEGLGSPGDQMWLFSRTEPSFAGRSDGVRRHWTYIDCSTPESLEVLRGTLGDEPLDMLIYCAGIWESSADILQVGIAETYQIIAVNLAGFIGAVQVLAANLNAAERGCVVAIGSTAGLENATGPRTAYAASKFGLRGAVHSLREVFRESCVATTCISIGGLASDVSFDEGMTAALTRHKSTRIPTRDVISVLLMLKGLSKATLIKEIDMPAQFDVGV